MEPEQGDDIAYCGSDGRMMAPECPIQPKVEVRRSAGKTVEMSLADFTANYTPKNELRPESKVSFTCEDLDSSILAEVLQKISPNEITVPERRSNKKLNFTLKNTTLAE